MAGQRIDDHGSWMGGKGKMSPLPDGVKTKDMSHAQGAGALSEYEDTDEKIRSVQEMNVSKAKSSALKSGFRH